MNTFIKKNMGLLLKLIFAFILFPVTIFIGFIIDTEIFGHVEGFQGVFNSIPIAIVLTLCAIFCVLYNHFKGKELRPEDSDK